jgi:hypothetical protein
VHAVAAWTGTTVGVDVAITEPLSDLFVRLVLLWNATGEARRYLVPVVRAPVPLRWLTMPLRNQTARKAGRSPPPTRPSVGIRL